MTHCFGTEGDCRIEYLHSGNIVLVQRVIAGLSTYPHDTCFGTEGDCRIEYLPSGNIVLVQRVIAGQYLPS